MPEEDKALCTRTVTGFVQCEPVATHFNSEGHGKSDLKYEIIAQLRENPDLESTTKKRRSLELRWIFRLHTFSPQGLNDKIAG